MEDAYREIRLLGEGSYGKCYLVEDRRDQSKWVLKQIDMHNMPESEKREALKEAKILKALEHPNIVRCYDCYTTKNGKLCIVMEYADGGDLGAKLKAQRGRYFPEWQILDWFVQMCLALKHVHDRKVVHRDIKAQNVFLTSNNIIKFGDFGIARVLTNTHDNLRTMIGTPYYLSPEICENRPYSFKSDIWSLGVLLYELCALKPPFDGNSIHNLALKIVRGNYSPLPAQFSRELRTLIGQMLNIDANRRPTISQILKQDIIKTRIRRFLSESMHNNEFSHTILHKQNLFQAPRRMPSREVLTKERVQKVRNAPQPAYNDVRIQKKESSDKRREEADKKRKEELRQKYEEEEKKVQQAKDQQIRKKLEQRKALEDSRKQMLQDIRKRKAEAKKSKKEGAQDQQYIIYEMQEVILEEDEEEELERSSLQVSPEEEEDYKERDDIIEDAQARQNGSGQNSSVPEETYLMRSQIKREEQINEAPMLSLNEIISQNEQLVQCSDQLDPLRTYLEERLGQSVLYRLYEMIKEIPQSDWNYEDFYGGWDNVVKPELLRECIPLLDSLLYMESVMGSNQI